MYIVTPGTLWCGPGNDADDNGTNVGEEIETDKCCRAHDLCSPFINVGESNYGLSTNVALWAKYVILYLYKFK